MIFCTNTTYADGGSKGDLANNGISASDLSSLSVQHELKDAWSDLEKTNLPTAHAEVHVLGSVEEAVELARREGGDVLVTGSLHLVGGVMEVARLPIS